MKSQSGDASQGIEVELMPDGTLRVGISSRKTDQEPITDIVETMFRDCQDDSFGMFDKLRDQEAREITEKETVDVKVRMRIKRVTFRRVQ
jgi:hypothetical protein